MRRLDPVLLLAAALWLATPGPTACEFDATGVPPLPDGILSHNEGSDSGGGGGVPVDCERSRPDLGSFGAKEGLLTGTWARRLVLKSERDTRNTGEWKDSTWTVYERVEVSHRGTTVREEVEVCGISMGIIDGAVTGFPQRLLDTLPVLAEEGELLTEATAGGTVGAAYRNPVPLVRLYGLATAAASKPWEPCKSYFNEAKLADECPLAMWPEIVDMDCDGHIGVTLDMTVGSADTEQVYMVQRDVMTRSGTVKSADRIDGSLTFEENNANLGSTQAMIKSNPPSRTVEGATFTMVRLAAGATCADANGAKFDE
jgi:hypothetical protein